MSRPLVTLGMRAAHVLAHVPGTPRQSVVIRDGRVTIQSVQRFVYGNARSHEPKVASAAHPNEQWGIGQEDT